MIQINLLPAKVKKKTEVGVPFAPLYVASIVIAALVIGYLWFTSASEVDRLNARVAQLNQEVSKLARFDAMLKELTAKKDLIDKKRAIIKDLKKDRDSLVRALALLSIQAPPDKMWFDKLTKAANTITLDGVALSNEAIVEFMRNLESSPYVEPGSISLVHSRQTTIRNMKLREFEVVYRFLSFSDVKSKLKL
jgi:type IV pilus assembly protein PilN